MAKIGKYKPSKIDTAERCFLCFLLYGANNDTALERHHCLHGTGMRVLAHEDGLWVYLCRPHHMRLHDYNEHDKELQIIAQHAYEKEHGREAFLKRYGKFYD